jgi:hypothetical protein
MFNKLKEKVKKFFNTPVDYVPPFEPPDTDEFTQRENENTVDEKPRWWASFKIKF